MRRLLLALMLCPSFAQAGDEAACQTAIAAASQKLAVPHRVLGTIAIVESGRPIGGRVVPWPWSINVGGVGRIFASKNEAVTAVHDLLAAGTNSIDVGCMQINLAAHPQAFSSLEAAFDPVTNTDYAARFLQSLSQQTGHLATAMTAYHSQTPQVANDYARRLLTVWPGAAAIGVTAEPGQPAAPTPYTSGLARLLADDHVLLRDRSRPLKTNAAPSQIEIVSAHGAAWPGANH